MSEVITGVLKFAFGLVSNKLRFYGAKKLQDGGLADQKFRGWIVRELDDIKFKLDANVRRELFASISCLQQGVQRLNTCIDEVSEGENTSPCELLIEGSQPQDTTNAAASSSTQTKPTQKSSSLEDAIALANALGKLKIDSNELFEDAKKLFKQAADEARRAFYNAALSTNERILASEVRIASAILEYLDSPEVAASDCLHYLEELHDMPAIQEIFSVHVSGGIKSALKSAFKRDSRAAIVETVTMINFMLADFITKFTKRRMGVLDWPMIQSGSRVVHPIHYEEETVEKIREMKITLPWDIFTAKTDSDLWRVLAINSKGDIIGIRSNENNLKKLDRATGEWQLFSNSPLPLDYKIDGSKAQVKRRLAIDENDTVYVVSYMYVFALCKPLASHELSVYNSEGRLIGHSSLDFIKDEIPRRITVNKNKNIVILCYGGSVFLCKTSGELMESFLVPLKNKEIIDLVSVSCEKSADEITVIVYKIPSEQIKLDAYTKKGQLKRTVKVRRKPPYCYKWSNLNLVSKNYNFCTVLPAPIYSSNYKDGEIFYEESDLRSGEPRNFLRLDGKYILNIESCLEERVRLISHVHGAIALVTSHRVLYLQSPSM